MRWNERTALTALHRGVALDRDAVELGVHGECAVVSGLVTCPAVPVGEGVVAGDVALGRSPSYCGAQTKELHELRGQRAAHSPSLCSPPGNPT